MVAPMVRRQSGKIDGLIQPGIDLGQAAKRPRKSSSLFRSGLALFKVK